MPTNYPTGLDTIGAAGTIGGPFIDAAPPVDLFVDIAADFRTNLNDAMLAVQARVGLTNDTNPGSLSWATISEGGVANLGLRFAADNTQWPGAVGESGIFLKDTTFEPMFHRAGEPVGTFYSMLGGSGSGTLQDSYNASASPAILATTGTKNFQIETHSSGATFVVANEGGANHFISADEVAGELTLGDTSTLKLIMNGQVSSNISFDGNPRTLTNTNADLNLQTVGTGNVFFDAAGNILGLAAGGVYLTGTAGKVELKGNDVDSIAVTGDVGLDARAGNVNIRTASGESVQVITGTIDPSSVATDAETGSLFLRDNAPTGGELYVKQDDGSSTNWTQLGTGGGSGTLQDAYNNSGTPAVIATTASKHLNFRTASAGATFIVSDQADASTFLIADEAGGSLKLGSGTVYTLDMDGRVSSNIQFDGSPRSILNSGALTLSVAGVAPVPMSLLATGKMTITGESLDVTTTSGDLSFVSSGGFDIETSGSSETMRILTGSDDPTSVAKWAYRGSLYLRDTGAVGELYVKQDDASSTNWTQLGTGGGGTLQDAYNAGNTITTAGGLPFSLDGSEDFLWQSSTSNTFTLGSIATDTTSLGGLFRMVCRVGADGVVGVQSDTYNFPGGNGREFGSFFATTSDASDLDDTDIIYGYGANVVMNGNGPATGFSVGAAFYAQAASFTGTNVHQSVGLYVDASYDEFLRANTGGAYVAWGAATESTIFDAFNISGGNTSTSGLFNRLTRSGAQNSLFEVTSMLLESVANGGDQLGGTAQQYNIDTASSSSNPLLAGGVMTAVEFDHRMDAADAGTAWQESLKIEYQIPNSPGGTADLGCSAYGAYVSIPETYDSAGGFYHNNDGFFSFNRWAFYAENGESYFRRTEFEGPINLDKALVRFNQADNQSPFHELEGNSSGGVPTTPNCNLTNINTGSNVVGPLDASWSWLGMYQVYVIDSAGAIPNGHYWVPLYEAI